MENFTTENLLMRSYFITGGTGFIGREIVRQLLAAEDTAEVVCLTRGKRTDLLQHPKLSFHIADITSGNLPDRKFTDLIHGANEANDMMQPDQYEYYHTIVEGTANVLKWAEQQNIGWRIILSSGAVSRDTIYGRAKATCETLARLYPRNTKIARIYSVLGEEMPINGQFAAGRFVWQALQGKIEYYGGQSKRTYLHVSDCAAWILRILTQGMPLLPYDVAGDTQITIEELAFKVANEFGCKVSKVGGPDRIDSYLPNVTESYQLGCRQTISIEESLRRIRRIHANYANLRHSNTQQATGIAHSDSVDSLADSAKHHGYEVQHHPV